MDKLKANSKNVPHCKHYVIRKKRYCKMTLRKGEEYCGEHMPHLKDTSSDTKLRVVCPLDRKHTCYAHKLAKHLKICNARVDKTIPYIVKDINASDGEVQLLPNEDVLSQSLDSYGAQDIKDVINKIIKLYDEIKVEIKEKILKHKLLEDEIVKPELGEKSKKHLYQTSSILGYLIEYNLLQSNTCVIEFGAGKGKLSFWITTALESTKDSNVLLIERASPRHKMDNKLDKSTGNVHRIRADIADLVLSKLDAIKPGMQVVGVTKHLCGEATDLALRCLKNYQDEGKEVSGMIMAFCCHHRCRWKPYTGKDFFTVNKLNAKDFDIMRGIASWSTCGTGFSREKNRNITSDVYHSSLESMSDRDKAIGLTREEKEIVGKKCKILLNYGRLKYLEKNNFKCELFYYVHSDVSLENLCIVAFKENK